MKTKLIILLSILLIGCKTKHTVTTTTQTDTIYKSKVIRVQPSQLQELVIDEICDSLGTLKTFSHTITSNHGEVSLKSDDNTLKLEINLDSIKSVWEKERVVSVTDKSEVNTITKKYIPKWIWYLLIPSLLLNAWFFRSPILLFIKKLL